ncbi:MAG: ABC transporter permease subunit, partial [Clostridiales bacterium]|nr:ABC transporter permease subunit [Clostridiales bacterium]
GFGYGSIVYYATLTGFDPGLYEAAEIDGASRWKKITKITLPLLRPIIIVLFILNVGGILRGSLEQIMGMTKMNPLLFQTTDTITTFVYRTTTQNGQFATASAIGLYQSLFGFLLVLGTNLIVKKIDSGYALF